MRNEASTTQTDENGHPCFHLAETLIENKSTFQREQRNGHPCFEATEIFHAVVTRSEALDCI
jgi:hypothetical protein